MSPLLFDQVDQDYRELLSKMHYLSYSRQLLLLLLPLLSQVITALPKNLKPWINNDLAITPPMGFVSSSPSLSHADSDKQTDGTHTIIIPALQTKPSFTVMRKLLYPLVSLI